MLRLVYRWLLCLHPPYFKRRFGEEMLSIFDLAPGNLARTGLIADGSFSLVRQWLLRSEYWEEPTHQTASDGVPLFYTFDNFKPRPDALIDGAVLSVVMFCAVCLAIRYSLDHPVWMPFPDVRAEDSLPPVAMRNSSTTPMNATGVPSANGQRPDAGAVKSRNTLPQIGTGNARDGSQPGASHLAIAAEQRKTNSLTAMPDAGFISEPTEPRTIQLPHPSGKYGVSRISYDWIDKVRRENYATDPHTRREIMVNVWYPTRSGSGQSAFSEYLPHAQAIAKSLKEVPSNEIEEAWGGSWASIFSGRVLTDTYEGKPIFPGSERFPVLIFSPGFTALSTSYTTLIEEVVSQGYVVASIEPTYDVAAVAFPGERVIPFKPQWQPGEEPPPSGETWQQFLERIRAFDASHVETWAADIQFVIDQLAALENSGREAAPFVGRIDLRNIGTWGHSLGGRAAYRACLVDSRTKACLNADGGIPEEATLPAKPSMWIDVYHEPATDAQLAVHKITRKEWEKFHRAKLAATEQRLRACPGGCYRLTIKMLGIDHYSFTDSPVLDAESKEDLDKAVRSLQLIEVYSVAFFDKHLKHQATPLLDQPTTSAGITLEKYGKAP
jgi:dienelactone hydrolase